MRSFLLQHRSYDKSIQRLRRVLRESRTDRSCWKSLRTVACLRTALMPLTGTYRFHGLFRDFLLRRLEAERSEGEIPALHIHAASYFETHALWPEAIHHYLEAGLQPQAARLIANYGEDLVSTGRLPLVEEWLKDLPQKTVHDNARLSLLRGEMHGLSGDWERLWRSLARATVLCAKGRSEDGAVACSKLSTVHNDYGDTAESARLAREAQRRPRETRMELEFRLRGNLAVTTTFFESFEVAIQE